MTGGKSFKADDTTIEQLLFANDKYKIPRYQRPYAWGEDEVFEFWNDINDNDSSYFLGAFILNYENKDKPNGFVDVIDGQQRMLSITIFMSVLRDVAKGIDNEWAELVQRKDIAFEGREGEETFRITCGDSTRPFFEKHIQDFQGDATLAIPNNKEEKLIRNNYLFFREKILSEMKDLADKEKLEYLKELRSKVSRLMVIHIRINSEDDAYEIFETTNARGVELSVADLVKNLIFNKIRSSEGRDVAKRDWQNMVANVEATKTDIKKFIRYYWISRYSFVTDKKLFREIKKEISDWKAFLNDLLEASNLYYLLFAGTETEWRELKLKKTPRIYKAVEATRWMNVSQCYVLFMCILRNYEKLGTDPTRIFEIIEKFTFNYSAVSKLPGNKVERVYSRCAQRLEKVIKTRSGTQVAKKVQTIFHEFEAELKNERPVKDYFVEEFMNIKYKNSEPARALIKYILSEINAVYEETRERKIDFNEVNIEHIVPQNPDSSWHINRDEIKNYVNDLGNLTLLDKRINSAIGNRSLSEKVKLLKKSTIPITKMVVKELEEDPSSWNASGISARQEGLAYQAYEEVWDF